MQFLRQGRRGNGKRVRFILTAPVAIACCLLGRPSPAQPAGSVVEVSNGGPLREAVFFCEGGHGRLHAIYVGGRP